jgi:hypothetical protein
MVRNFAIVYIEMAFERSTVEVSIWDGVSLWIFFLWCVCWVYRHCCIDVMMLCPREHSSEIGTVLNDNALQDGASFMTSVCFKNQLRQQP